MPYIYRCAYITLCCNANVLLLFQGTVHVMDRMGHIGGRTPFADISNTTIGEGEGGVEENMDPDDDSDWLHRNETYQTLPQRETGR
ncbi:hypothetical protein U9M48_031108, partial [Paspalum notatum var. saurae]